MKYLIKCFLLILMILMIGCQKQIVLKVKECVTVELGTKISSHVIDYLDTTSFSQETIHDIVSNTKLELIDQNEKSISLLQNIPIGEYQMRLSYNNQIAKVKIIVQDTVKPEFIDFLDTIQVSLGKQVSDDDFCVRDASNHVMIEIDDDQVDYHKEGQYIAQVTATDSSNNSMTKDFTIDVIDEQKKTIVKNKTNKTTDVSSNQTSNQSNQDSQMNTSDHQEIKEDLDSVSENQSIEIQEWAMTEDEMLLYAKECVKEKGFTWCEELTKDHSGWYAPTTIKITWSKDQIKSEIKLFIDEMADTLNPEQYGFKCLFEKKSDTQIEYYVLY